MEGNTGGQSNWALINYTIITFLCSYIKIETSQWNGHEKDQPCSEYMGNALPQPFPALEWPECRGRGSNLRLNIGHIGFNRWILCREVNVHKPRESSIQN